MAIETLEFKPLGWLSACLSELSDHWVVPTPLWGRSLDTSVGA